jgi:hypothetical protein
MTDFPDLKFRALVSFPATILDGTGIDIVKQNGSYQFNLDFGDFAPPLAGLSDPAHQNALVWNQLTGQYALIPASVFTSGGVAPATAVPLIESGSGGVGSSLKYAREDHVHPALSIPAAPRVDVADITALQAIDTTLAQFAVVRAAGVGGDFVWRSGGYTGQIAADTTQGVYIKANAIPASAGAWVRSFDNENYYSEWFGCTAANSSATNTSLISTALVVMAQYNATMSAVMHIEPGILFSIRGLVLTGVSSQIHIELDYLADNETSQGSQATNQGTSERKHLIVSSGFPANVNGGVVIEHTISGPLNPALVVDVRKEMANTNAFFNDGVSVPSAKQNRLPPLNNSDAARASIILRDEGVNRFGAVYTGFANSTLTSIGLSTYRNTRSLAGGVGFTSPAAWGGLAGNVPAIGDIITGQTSGFRGIVYLTPAGDIIDTIWVQGRPVAGEFFRNERTGTVSTVGLSGAAIGYAEKANSALFFAINTPNISIDVEPGDLQTVFGVGGRLTITKSRGLGAQTMETVTNPALMFAEGVAAPTAALQIVYDTSVAAASRRLTLVRGNSKATAPLGHLGSSTAHGAFFYSGSVGILSGGFNVANIVRNSIGNYTVTFTQAMASVNYKVVFGSASYADLPSYGTRATGSFVILVHDYLGALRDPAEIAFEVKGGDI